MIYITKLFTVLFILFVLLLCFACKKALWEDSKYTEEDKKIAIWNGVKWMNKYSNSGYNFSDYPVDFLEYYYVFGQQVKDKDIRNFIWKTGKFWAIKYLHDSVSINQPSELFDYIRGTYLLSKFGLDIKKNLDTINESLKRFKEKELFPFDLKSKDINRDIIADALYDLYFVEKLDLKFKITYKDLISYTRNSIIYDSSNTIDNEIYRMDQKLIKKMIYTLSNLSLNKLDSRKFKNEIEYLQKTIAHSIELNDPDYVGKSIDCLKVLTQVDDINVRNGIEYLLSSQREDGSWLSADSEESDVYAHLYSTVRALSGLIDFEYSSEGFSNKNN